MDTEELRAALAAREQFAPDTDAVLEAVLAHPPRATGRRHSRRYLAAVGIAAVVVLIAGTVGLVRFLGSRPATAGPHPGTITSATTSASTVAATSASIGQIFPAKLAGIYWEIATIARGPAGAPTSASLTDHFSLLFQSDGTVQLTESCQNENVHWTSTGQTLTIDRLPPAARVEPCAKDNGPPSAAASQLAAARTAMTSGQTVGHLDGKSLVLETGGYVEVFRTFDSTPRSALEPPGGNSVDTAAQQWAGFPVSARPRPVVGVSPTIVLPVAPLPNGRDENALAAGRIVLSAALPSGPATRNGYPIVTAAAAVAQLVDPPQAAPNKSFVHITNVQLIDHPFVTDRGEMPLPTWQVRLAESRDPIYILAVAAAGRYPATLTIDPGLGGFALVTSAGRDVTVPFEAHHESSGHCDPNYTSTFASKETPTAVIVAVTRQLDPGFPQPGCSNAYGSLSINPGPGSPNTKTLHLQQPLGNRAIVDNLGIPYLVETQ